MANAWARSENNQHGAVHWHFYRHQDSELIQATKLRLKSRKNSRSSLTHKGLQRCQQQLSSASRCKAPNICAAK
eukprot:scaffold699_cov18-Tisochrysis_lutea.AAC.3